MGNNEKNADNTAEQINIADVARDIPPELPILPLRNLVVYPFNVVPLAVGIARSKKLIEDAMQGNRLIGLVSMKNPEIEEPVPGQIHEVGTIAKVERVLQTQGENIQVIVQGLERFRIEYWLTDKPYLKAHIQPATDLIDHDVEMDALQRSLQELAQAVVGLSPNMPKEAGDLLAQVKDPRYLTYLVAAAISLEVEKAQEILASDRVKDKIRLLISHLSHEKEVLSLGKKIQTEAREEMDKAQREYFLRQQLKAIRKELGESEEGGPSEAGEYADKLAGADLPEEARKEAQRELNRLKNMSPHSPEYSVIKTYLDWILELPWKTLSEDQTDIRHARAILDEDHYDLAEVKDRIVEYLAVRKLIMERGLKLPSAGEEAAAEAMGVILCFSGPPGVGKTSLGKSIARALGRKFTRMSLGGMRDEAEIRGHRRTYIGAMPGRIIQGIKRTGTRNPVFMLDEVDKIGADWRGDPSSALLEVLDPAQNHAFRDYYLDVDFDLSDVIFITTANQLETIPRPLRDRMEIIQLDGYTEYEKIQIALRHLVPRQVKANGLQEEEITFTEEALHKIVRDYTREAGVRNLERQVGAVCRKSAVKIAGGEWSHVVVTPEMVRSQLKREKFESESLEDTEIPGIATGLAVTEVGGDIIFIEATRMQGRGKLNLTGQLGDVMRESAQIAHSYVRSKADQLGIDPEEFELFTGRPVRGDVGMTGEVTLRGRLLPVGGIKMKMLAAHRAGLTTVILPKRNEKDLDDLPDEVRNTMLFVTAERIDEALDTAFCPPAPLKREAVDSAQPGMS
ncbi:MAG: endopeptidase La [Desulfobacterales bacterium]